VWGPPSLLFYRYGECFPQAVNQTRIVATLSSPSVSKFKKKWSYDSNSLQVFVAYLKGINRTASEADPVISVLNVIS
jgi:hypothetical protein